MSHDGEGVWVGPKLISQGARVGLLPADVQDRAGVASMAWLGNQPGLGSTPVLTTFELC